MHRNKTRFKTIPANIQTLGIFRKAETFTPKTDDAVDANTHIGSLIIRNKMQFKKHLMSVKFNITSHM